MIKEKYSVDRIENKKVILISFENGSVIELEKSHFPDNVKDGDIVYAYLSDDGALEKIEINKKETTDRKNELKQKLSALFDK